MDRTYDLDPYYNGATVFKADEVLFLNKITRINNLGFDTRMTCTIFESKATYDKMLAIGFDTTVWQLKWNWIKGA
jgi:hypothetical protein